MKEHIDKNGHLNRHCEIHDAWWCSDCLKECIICEQRRHEADGIYPENFPEHLKKEVKKT